MDIIIIGAGMAAYTAASQLVKSEGMKITIISKERIAPYYRTRILETLSGTDVSALLADTSAFPQERFSLRTGVEVLSIDRKSKSVKLSDGSLLSYDKLVIATGSNANKLSIPGSDAEGIIAVRTIDDALSLKEMVKSATKPAVIGGGLLGLEAAYTLYKASGRKVTVLEGFPYLLPRQLDRASADFLQSILEEKGLVFETGVKIAGFESRDKKVSAVALEGGRSVEADLVLESVGVTPDIALAAEAGLAVNRGILVDSQLRTSDEDIYAIGDVAEAEGKVPGLMSTAMDMGRTLASILEGKQILYKTAPPAAMLKVAGLDLFSFGSVSEEGVEKFVRNSGKSYECLFVKDGIVTGATSIGTREHMALFKSSIGKSFDAALREKAGL